MLADQLCAIELSAVRELLGYMPFTPTSCDHPAIVGWFDLRGKPVRVMDLRIRLGTAPNRTDDTVMIVVDWSGVTLALIVDKCVGLENLSSVSPISFTQRLRIDPRFTAGTATVQDRTIVILDIARTIVIPPPLPKAA